MNWLIYLAHGPAGLKAEALYSLLSYFEVAAAPAGVLVYTDTPATFRQVLGERPDVQYPAVTDTQWQQWRGQSNQVYLVKIQVLIHAAAHYPGNLLLVDTDTIWQTDPAPLFAAVAQGKRLMHALESRLAAGDLLSRKVYQHLRGRTYAAGPHAVQVTTATLSYNSGVVGIASQQAALLPEVLELAEQFYATYNKHPMEQLAFSIRFALAGPIGLAAPYVLHYWNLKAVRPVLARLFEKYAGHPPAELLARATALGLPALHHAELAYRNLPGWRRTLRKLQGRRWQLPALEV